MRRAAVFMALLLAGCATYKPAEVVTEAPELIRMAPLPATNTPLPMGGLKLYVLLQVLEDGSVGEARLLESSGYTEWDTLAIRSIMKWHFTPARNNGVPVPLWIRQPIVVQAQEAMLCALGELVVGTKNEADSLYKLLENGADFDSLARRASIAPSRERGGYLGCVDVAVYTVQVREQLRKLRDNQTAPPIRVGDSYIIYKKYKRGD